MRSRAAGTKRARLDRPGSAETSPASPVIRPGELVLRRMFRGAHVIWVQACRVVSDDDRGLLLWLPVGAGFAHRPQPAELGERSPRQIDQLGRSAVLVETWRDHDVLILVPPVAPYSVWWFFTGGEFAYWYVNLERPSERWTATGWSASTASTTRWTCWSRRERQWRWKDEDELDERVGLPGYWSAQRRRPRSGRTALGWSRRRGRAVPVRRHLVRLRPDPAWPLPELPSAGWDTPPTWDDEATG